MKFSKILMAAAVASTGFLAACTEDSPITNPPVVKEEIVIDRTKFAKGADVSWLTQLEKEGEVFYTPGDREQMECMQLLRDYCGMNSIRLRVWVNPANGWCNIQTAVATHVTDMLTKLQALGIEPEWVQIGNETRGGMLYPLGDVTNGTNNLALLVNAGYDAVKAIFPAAQVIIHLDSGDTAWLYTRMFDYLSQNGGKYDIIGMSLYPDVDTWRQQVDDCIANINAVSATYGKPVMICEVGMRYDEVEASGAMLAYLRQQCETATSGQCKGIFYWEPEAPSGYNGGYQMGAFADGAPTAALDAFKD